MAVSFEFCVGSVPRGEKSRDIPSDWLGK